MSYSSEVLADSPRVYYRCQETSGQLVDSSGNGHTTNTILGPSGGAAGLIRYREPSPILTDSTDFAITLDGKSAFLLTAVADVDLGDVWTLEFWGRRAFPAVTTNQVVIDKGGDGVSNGAYQCRLPSDTNTFDVNRASIAALTTSTITITDTAWHHYVGTKNGATIAEYIDGVDRTSSIGNSTCNNTSPADDLLIGCDEQAGAFWTGSLDEIAIYPTALSAARVKVHHDVATLTQIAWTRA